VKRLGKAMVGYIRYDGRRVGDYEVLGVVPVMHRNKGMVRGGQKGERKYGESTQQAQWLKEWRKGHGSTAKVRSRVKR
jgi:hypothetical protein